MKYDEFKDEIHKFKNKKKRPKNTKNVASRNLKKQHKKQFGKKGRR